LWSFSGESKIKAIRRVVLFVLCGACIVGAASILVPAALYVAFWASLGKAMGPHYGDKLPSSLSGVIDQDGKAILPVRYLAIGDFHEGLATITNGEYINGTKFYSGPSYDKEKLVGYVDIDGKIVIKPAYWTASDFSDGLAKINIDNEHVIFIDRTGKKALGPLGSDISDFQNGIALQGDRPGYSPSHMVAIDKLGRILHSDILDRMNECGYTTFEQLKEDGFTISGTGIERFGEPVASGKWTDYRGFREALAAVAVDKKWGYVDRQGRYQIAPQFEDVMPFSQRLARVRIGGKWGFIDRSGKFVIAPTFEQVEDFAEDFARFAKTGVNGSLVWGFINRKGQVVVAPRYIAAHDFSDGRAAVQTITFSKWGFIDKSGKLVVPDTYDSVSDFHDHRAVVTQAYP
jgi:hypothetical protein